MQKTDWRNIVNGFEIPPVLYSDQPFEDLLKIIQQVFKKGSMPPVSSDICIGFI
jgi:hypothetical protein